MRLLLILLAYSAAFAFDTSALRAAWPMSCFRYRNGHPARHDWELNYERLSPYWVLLRKDDTGFLVAQPAPSCEENTRKAICPFWIRTVEYSDNWVPPGMLWVPCPKTLNETYFRRWIKQHNPDEFRFEPGGR